MIKRKSIIFIASLLAAAIFVSCAPADDRETEGDVDIRTNETTPEEIAPDEDAWLAAVTPDLPDIRFDGFEFRILNTENDSVPWLLTQLEAEELTGDPFSDAVYLRNRAIEDRFDILIRETAVADYGVVSSMARRGIQAGDDEFDLYMLPRDQALGFARDGFLIDYFNIPHVDLSRIYWDQNMAADLSINNRLFTMAGDFSFTHYSATMVMFFNKALHADLALEDPYQMVRDGRWTFDAFHQMARTAVRDLNGDGIMDERDQFGYLSLYPLAYPTFMFAAGERYMRKDADDRPVLSIGGERWVTAFLAIMDIMLDGDLFFCAEVAGNHRLQDVMFPNNQALFWTELMNWAMILRGMEADFGILPHPKLDEVQENYYSVVWGCTFMGVPITTQDLARTGVIIEALSAESRRTVMPVYYDVVLSTVIARDDESGEMLDIIFANRVYDLALQFFEGVIVSPFNTQAHRRGNADIASILEANVNRMERQIQSLMDRFDELN